MNELICPICDKTVDYVPGGAHHDLARHMGAKHGIIDIIKSYTSYYLEQNDFPLDELKWGDE